jgi:hypothetical protein
VDDWNFDWPDFTPKPPDDATMQRLRPILSTDKRAPAYCSGMWSAMAGVVNDPSLVGDRAGLHRYMERVFTIGGREGINVDLRPLTSEIVAGLEKAGALTADDRARVSGKLNEFSVAAGKL